MTGRAPFAYALGRLHARFAQLPDAALWHQVEGTGGFPHYLRTARGTALRQWLGAIGPQSSAHEAEAALRGHFRRQVAEVAHWLPKAWHAPIAWLAVLVDLPAIDHLRHDGKRLGWMEEDTPLQRLTREFEEGGVTPDNPYAPLFAPGSDGLALAAAWHHHWHRLWPEHERELARMEQRAAASLHRLRDGMEASTEAWNELYRLLHRGFRREASGPAAAFCYLGLVLLTLQRLRSGIVERLLFASGNDRAA